MPDHVAIARAKGRRRLNGMRRAQAMARRVQVVEMLTEHGFGYGVPAKIARSLGVHRSTITRDITAIIDELGTPRGPWCPMCGRADFPDPATED